MGAKTARLRSKLDRGIPADVVAQGKKLMDYDPTKVAPNTAWSRVAAFLEDQGFMREECPEADALAVHADNRGGPMCSGEDVEGKGLKIIEAGAKTPMGALAMQLCPLDDPMRDVHVHNNQQMIARAGGKLAEWTGKERLLTLATSQCSQFSKAVHARCRTSIEKLQDSSGKLAKSKLEEMDPQMSNFLKGWPFKVISWKCELAWPGLAHLSQLAQNSDNAVGKAMGELEAAIAMTKYSAGGLQWDQAAEAAKATSAEEAPIQGILAIAKFYGHDAGMPLAIRLEKFRSSLQLKVKMGGAYLTDVAGMAFKGHGLKQFPFVRLGCMAANLLAHKVEYGVGVCFQKSDIAWFQSPTNHEAVSVLETSAMKLDERLGDMVFQGSMSENNRCDIFFKFLIRNWLHLREKEKLGYEGRQFDSCEEIRRMAASEIQKLDGSPNPCKWTPLEEGAATSAPATLAITSFVESAADLNCEAKALQAKGYAVGKQVMELGSPPTQGLRVIHKITDGTVVLRKETFGGLQRGFDADATATDLVKKFKKLPMLMDASAALRHVRSRTQFVHDWARVRAWKVISLSAIGACVDGGDGFLFMVNPRKLFTKRAVKAKEMQLLPSTHPECVKIDEKLKFKNSLTACTVHLDDDGEAIDVSIVLTAPPTTTTTEPATWGEKIAFEPFWWVDTTSDEKLATVVKEVIYKDGVAFTRLVNPKALQANTEAVLFAPKKGAEPRTTLHEKAVREGRYLVPPMRRKRYKQSP
ncbi:unnamed protein product [Prorocentrum cordatum]|uniref:Uncharacterized protein n=1 Tax=Prorocentrum cordatum TaxID=2364126 RepID=A0ABN9X4K2_9DINO|nr:unnamed protein product [Polarella glacialis]